MTKNRVLTSLRCPSIVMTSVLAAVLAGVGIAAGCGGRPVRRELGQAAEVPAVAPTPDTTPVAALRTPAGLVLKTSVEQAPTPSPAAEATPKSSP